VDFVNTANGPPTLESDGKTSPRPRPKFGLTKWGISVQRLSSKVHHSNNRGIPSSSRASSPEKKQSSGTPSGVPGTPEPLPAVLEVWFAGCHSDVGGGSVKDAVRHSLADISLRWMVKQVILSQCGIRFDAAALRKSDIDVSTIILAGATQSIAKQFFGRETEAGSSSPGSSGEEGSGEHMIRKKDADIQTWPRDQDALADMHDQLKSQPMWWPLELMPMKFTWQEADGTWKSEWGYVITDSAHLC